MIKYTKMKGGSQVLELDLTSRLKQMFKFYNTIQGNKNKNDKEQYLVTAFKK